MNILFMCVANSARSQMAEGLARTIFGPKATVASAGSQPSKVNPLATKAMDEIGIDISEQYSKSYDDLTPAFIVNLDFVITLCDEEVCPRMVTPKAKTLQWPFPDPAKAGGTEEEQLNQFRRVREALTKRLKEFAQEVLA